MSKKQFLYLDVDMVNSIIAQEEKGLVMQWENEKSRTEGGSDDDRLNVNTSGKVSGSLFKFAQAEAQLGATYDNGSSESYEYGSRRLITRTLNDAAFDVAYRYIEHEICSPKEAEIASFVKMDTVFEIIDLGYLESILAPKGVMEYAKAGQIEKLEKEAKDGANFNREQNRKNGNNLKNEIKKLVESQFDEIRSIVSALRGILPYDRLLLSSTDGYLIPLEDKYFRIDPKGLGFKYGGEMTCIGRVTNVIGEDTDPCDNSFIFSTIQFQVNEAFRKILPTKHSNLYVVHPMAVYYE